MNKMLVIYLLEILVTTTVHNYMCIEMSQLFSYV